MQNTFAPLLLTLLLVSCSVTPKQPAVPIAPPLNTFRSEQYGLSFSYPAQWHINSESDNRALTGLDIIFSAEDPNAHEGMRIDTVTPRLTIAKRIYTIDKKMIRSQGDISVGGEPGKIVRQTSGFSNIFVKHGDFLYEFQTGGVLLTNGVIDSVKFFAQSSSSKSP